MVKCLSAMLEIQGSIPGLGRSPGEGNGTEEPGRTPVHGVTKSRTRLSDLTFD